MSRDHSLLLLLLSCAASTMLAHDGHAPAAIKPLPGRDAPTAQATPCATVPTACGNSPAARRAAASQGGGGGTDSLHTGVPRWNSFLPGMFR